MHLHQVIAHREASPRILEELIRYGHALDAAGSDDGASEFQKRYIGYNIGQIPAAIAKCNAENIDNLLAADTAVDATDLIDRTRMRYDSTVEQEIAKVVEAVFDEPVPYSLGKISCLPYLKSPANKSVDQVAGSLVGAADIKEYLFICFEHRHDATMFLLQMVTI